MTTKKSTALGYNMTTTATKRTAFNAVGLVSVLPIVAALPLVVLLALMLCYCIGCCTFKQEDKEDEESSETEAVKLDEANKHNDQRIDKE